MAKEVEVNYFMVTVKMQRETDQEDRAGNPKLEKWTEDWLAKAKTTEEANRLAKEYYEGTMDGWIITNVKATKILGILGI